jgi:3-oxoacyl-[acyl-carrier protein] reductase
MLFALVTGRSYTGISMDLGLRGATVCISGGTKGIGLALAQRLAGEGARLCITGRQQSSIDAAAAQLLEAGAMEAFGLALDLLDPAQISDAYAQLGARWGALNVLVNMAGTSDTPRHASFADYADEEWYRNLDMATLSAVRCARAALPWLRRAEWARIVNVSSIVSRLKTPETAPYATAKAALEALSKTMALTLAADGILVNTVTPGAVVTEALKEWMRAAGAAERCLDPENLRDCQRWVTEDFGGKTSSALGRCASPDEVAAVIAFVGSKTNSFMTGANIVVDGGTDYWS